MSQHYCRRMLMARILAALIATTAAAVTSPLYAADQTPIPPAPQNQSAVCLNSGNTYRVGDFACIAACHGERRLARCDMVSEQASWTFVSNACPSAMLPRGVDEANALPIVSVMTPIPLPIEHKMSEMSAEAWMRLVTARKALTVSQ